MKVVINVCYGGFGLSTEALKLWAELKGIPTWESTGSYGDTVISTVPPADETYNAQRISDRTMPRECPVLVQVVKTLGARANGRCAELAIVDIPEDVKWHVVEYDGLEHIAEDHRTWG